MSRKLKNREEIVEQMTDILVDFAKSCNQYQTDVYLYYDKETQTATLDTFINVGGNSWLNDDHYTVYSDPQHNDDWTDYYTETREFADGLDMEWNDFKQEVLDYLDLDDDEKDEYEFEYADAYRYIQSKNEYCDKLMKVYEDYIDETRPEYAEQAEQIISEWEESDCFY